MEQPTVPRVIFALVADLLDASKLRASAEQTNLDVRIVRSAAALHAQMSDAATPTGQAAGMVDQGRFPAEPPAVLIDLHVAGGMELVASLRAAFPTAAIAAYGSHVRAELLAAARRAGASPVLARSAIFAKLGDVLTALASDAAIDERQTGD